jgi:hypothetical protein
MRRFVVVAVIAVTSALALSACSMPAGIDGNLVNNWAAAPAPTAAVPIVGDCYNDDGTNMIDNLPVSCTTSHVIDVAYVGTFSGADASRVTPPAFGSPQQRAAYAKCQAPAATFLGADWHSGLLQLSVSLPDEDAWTGGARWFRCDVSMLDYPDGFPKSYSIALRNSLKTTTAASLKCVTWKDHKTYITDIVKSSCSKPFNGEYAGFFTAPNTAYPTNEKKRSQIQQDGCEGVVAHYLGFSGHSDQSFYVGWVNMPFDEDRWNSGDRTIRCFAAADTSDGKFTASVKGIRGNKPQG